MKFKQEGLEEELELICKVMKEHKLTKVKVGVIEVKKEPAKRLM